jgi:co-chaperonin GroES (HSP10)
MNYEKLKMLGDKVLVRISDKSIQDIYSKEITRNDGTKTKLFLTVPASDKDDRQSQLFVRTGVVISVGPGRYHPETGDRMEMPNIKNGDTVILSYEVFNDEKNFVGMDGEDKVVWVSANTIYHTADKWAYADRSMTLGRDRSGQPKMFKNDKDQLVWRKGDIDEISQIIGMIRGDKLIANDPYIFLNHAPTQREAKTKSGIIHTDKEEILERTVLATPGDKWKGMKQGDTVLVSEVDTFDIVLSDKKLTCVNDTDILWINPMVKLRAV